MITHGILGADKSVGDGPTEWALAYAGGVRWTSRRVCGYSGKPYPDPDYRDDHAAQVAQGIAPVPYAWLYPHKDLTQQIDCFLQNVIWRPDQVRTYPLLDLENSRWVSHYVGVGSKMVRPWLVEVERALGVRPLVYTGPSFIKTYLYDEPWLNEYPLLIAHWDVIGPYVPKPWTPDRAIGWQFGARDGKYFGYGLQNLQRVPKPIVCLQLWTAADPPQVIGTE